MRLTLFGAQSLNVPARLVSRDYVFRLKQWTDVVEQADLTYLLAHPVILREEQPLAPVWYVRAEGQRRSFLVNTEGRARLDFPRDGGFVAAPADVARAAIHRRAAVAAPLAYFLETHPQARAVITRGGGIGDLLLMTPALHELRRRFPQAHLTMSTVPGNTRLLEGIGVFDEVVDYFTAYDRAPFDYHADLNYYVEGRHEQGEHRCKLFGEGLGVTPMDYALSVMVTDDDRAAAAQLLEGLKRPLVGVQFANATATRILSRERLLRIMDLLWERGVAPLPFAQEALQSPEPSLCGRMSIGTLLAVIEAFDVVLVGDSGPMHIASAVGTPAVALFGMVAPGARVTGDKCTALWSGIPCAPCNGFRRANCQAPTDCLAKIPDQSIVDSIMEALDGSARNPS